jgi:hypothetical protein
VRATTAVDLAVVYKLPEPPADPAGLAGWEREVRRAAYCADPVRLAGRVEQADKRIGEVREDSTTEHEPGGVLLKACGNRRASVCPACAEVYRRDAWHLIAARLRGGKGIPETVSEHPRLFVTFTAPSSERSTPGGFTPATATYSPAIPTTPTPAVPTAARPPAGTATPRPSCAPWAGRCVMTASTEAGWRCGTPWRRSCGGAPWASPSTVPWPTSSASARPRSSAWSGCAT